MSQEKDQLEGTMPKSEKDLTAELRSLINVVEKDLRENVVEKDLRENFVENSNINNNNNNNNNNNYDKNNNKINNNFNKDLAIRQRRALNAKRKYEKLLKREMKDYETKYDVKKDQEETLQDELAKLNANNNKLKKEIYAKESKIKVDTRNLIRKLKAINTLEERFEEYKVKYKN